MDSEEIWKKEVLNTPKKLERVIDSQQIEECQSSDNSYFYAK